MSCPDLTQIIQALLFEHRLFSIKEQEDCRETAGNLFHLIEYLQILVRLFSSSSSLFDVDLVRRTQVGLFSVGVSSKYHRTSDGERSP